MPSKARHGWMIAGMVVVLLIVAAMVALSFIDDPLRRYVERQANDRLPGYHMTIGALSVHPFILAVELHDIVLRQDAYSEQALATIPQITANARIGPLLSGILSADLDIERPSISVTRRQVDRAMEDMTKEPAEEKVAWQDRLRDMMPFRMALSISNGEIQYEGPPAAWPILVHELDVRAENLTNRPNEGELYPSAVSVAARVLEEAHVELSGHADVLGKPHPGLDAEMALRNVRIDRALSVVGRSDLPLKQGVVETSAHVEYAPGKKAVTIHEFVLRHPKVEYVAETKSDPAEIHAKETAAQAPEWQDFLTDLFPITIRRLSIERGEMIYRPAPQVHPIQISNLGVSATNVRNQESQPGDYPSEVHVSAHLAERAQMTLDGRADLFAKPLPGVDAHVKVQDLQLRDFLPVAGHFNVQLRQGLLDLTGRVQYSQKSMVLAVDQFLLEGAKADYVHASHTVKRELSRVKNGVVQAKEVHQDPSITVKVEHGKILHSEVGFVNKAASPDYRIFMADMNVELDNFSNRLEDGTGVVKVTGKFMGSGPTTAIGTFRPEKPRPDFNLEVRIIKTKIKSMNNLLRAYGDIDTTGGLFAFFSELSVKDNHVDGYVKPLLKDVEVYDPKQDQDKAMTQKVYEAVVGGVLGVLENRPRSEVVTLTDVSGEVGNPQADTWQVVGNLIQNAFFKAILPGFAKGHVG